MPTLIQNEELIKKIAPLTVTASRAMQAVCTKDIVDRDGIGIIAVCQARLKQMQGMTDDDFADAIGGYKWMADKPFDWIPLPWQVIARKSDDCDGSGVLCCATRPECKMYLICAFNGSLPYRVEDWHYIAVQKLSKGYNVWSNFKRYKCSSIADWRSWVKKQYKWATMLVEVDPTLQGNPRACIKSFSAL